MKLVSTSWFVLFLVCHHGQRVISFLGRVRNIQKPIDPMLVQKEGEFNTVALSVYHPDSSILDNQNKKKIPFPKNIVPPPVFNDIEGKNGPSIYPPEEEDFKATAFLPLYKKNNAEPVVLPKFTNCETRNSYADVVRCDFAGGQVVPLSKVEKDANGKFKMKQKKARCKTGDGEVVEGNCEDNSDICTIEAGDKKSKNQQRVINVYAAVNFIYGLLLKFGFRFDKDGKFNKIPQQVNVEIVNAAAEGMANTRLVHKIIDKNDETVGILSAQPQEIVAGCLDEVIRNRIRSQTSENENADWEELTENENECTFHSADDPTTVMHEVFHTVYSRLLNRDWEEFRYLDFAENPFNRLLTEGFADAGTLLILDVRIIGKYISWVKNNDTNGIRVGDCDIAGQINALEKKMCDLYEDIDNFTPILPAMPSEMCPIVTELYELEPHGPTESSKVPDLLIPKPGGSNSDTSISSTFNEKPVDMKLRCKTPLTSISNTETEIKKHRWFKTPYKGMSPHHSKNAEWFVNEMRKDPTKCLWKNIAKYVWRKKSQFFGNDFLMDQDFWARKILEQMYNDRQEKKVNGKLAYPGLPWHAEEGSKHEEAYIKFIKKMGEYFLLFKEEQELTTAVKKGNYCGGHNRRTFGKVSPTVVAGEQLPDNGEPYNVLEQFLKPQDSDPSSGILMTINNFEQFWDKKQEKRENAIYYSGTIFSGMVMDTVDLWENRENKEYKNFKRVHARSLMLEILLQTFDSLGDFRLENVRACMFQALYNVIKSFIDQKKIEKKVLNYDKLEGVNWETEIVDLWNDMDLAFAHRGMGRGFRAKFENVAMCRKFPMCEEYPMKEAYKVVMTDRNIFRNKDEFGHTVNRFPPHEAAIQNFKQTKISKIEHAKNQLYMKLPKNYESWDEKKWKKEEKKNKDMHPWNEDHANSLWKKGDLLLCKKKNEKMKET